MRKVRIIPRLDIKGPNVVKGLFTEGLRVVGNPKELVTRYYTEGADEIVYMDIVASLYRRNLDFDQLRDVSDGIFIPFTVGGGIRSIEDITNALRAGADKVALNTYALHRPEILREAAELFGSQCISLSIEAKKQSNGTWEAFTDGGREKTGVNAIEWARKAIDLGVGEIIVTSIDRDGSRKGYDHELLEAFAFAPIPIIAHGGAGSMQSVLDVLKHTPIDDVALSSVLHYYKEYSIGALKEHLFQNSLPIRISY